MKHTVTEHKLAGGAKGLVVHVPNAPVINLVIRFNSGFQFGPRDKYELSHVLEHLMGCGSKAYPVPSEFKIEVQKNGAYRNAYTTSSVNGYVLEFAPFELERIMGLLKEYLCHPIFPDAAVPTELSNVGEELKRFTTQYGAVCTMNLSEYSFPEEDLGWHTRIDQLSSINRDEVVGHYKRTHTRDNARFFLGGDFPDGGASVAGMVDQALSDLLPGERMMPSRAIGLNVETPVVQTEDIKQIYYELDCYGGELTLPERRALLLGRIILSGGHASRIYGRARDRGLAYDLSTPTSTGKGRSAIGLSGYVTPTNAKELFELSATEFTKLRLGELNNQELTAAKDLVIGSTLRSRQTAQDMLGWYISPYDHDDRVDDFDEFMALVREVKSEEVVSVMGKLPLEGRHGVSFVGPVDEKLAGEYAKILEPIWQA